jgi:hypothetical protein
MKAFKTTVLLLTIAAVQSFGASSAAAPVVTSLAHYTDRFATHSIPGLPVGDKVQVNAFIDTNDPVGSPMISVEAVQGATTVALDPLILPEIYPGQHPYQKYIDFDPSLLGSWEIIPIDSTGIGPSEFTNAISEPEFVPPVENIRVGGTPVGSSVSWALPNLDSFDVDIAFVRVIEAVSGNPVYNSDPLPFQTTSFEPPAGELQYGVDYVYRIMLNDYEGDFPENRSNTFSEPFRFALGGDFNADGTVDAADYVAWRNGLGTTYTQNDYGVWRAHFGASLGSGSGAAGYLLGASAKPLSAAIPEPASLALLQLITVVLLFTSRGWVMAKNRC